MKKLLWIAMMLGFCIVASAGQTVAPSADEAAITRIEHDFYAAVVKRDTATLERLASDDCQVVDPGGQVISARQLIADIKTGAMTVESARIDQLSVRVFGDSAVAIGLETEKSKYKDEDTSGQYRFVDTFVKRKGEWVCVVAVVQRVTAPKP
jgi:ketosteroid isomerase-like protein